MSDSAGVLKAGTPRILPYAEVVVPRHLRRSFTYRIPSHLLGLLQVGYLVLIPFGRGRLNGLVTALLSELPPELRSGPAKREVRELIALVEPSMPAVAADLLELSRLVSDRYLAPWGQSLRLILPPGRPRGKTSRRDSHQPVKSLPASQRLQPVSGSPPASPWWDRLRRALDRGCHEALLMQGPSTARLNAILQGCDEALARKQAAIVIVPEIARASNLAALALARWGERVGLMHSDLPPSIRYDIWNRIRAGKIDLVIGTRAAIFAPLNHAGRTVGPPLGLICVDGEDDTALKDEQEPRYHAREVAWIRAQQCQGVLLLGSAHPSLETTAAIKPPNVEIISGPEAAAQPSIHIVDLRGEPTDTMLSPSLVEHLRISLEARSGAVLYLNRKGFASALFCRDCGAVPRCPRCSVTLRYYRSASRSGSRQDLEQRSTAPSGLRCLYCGTAEPVPEVCPACHSAGLHPVGFGTARLEEEIRKLFPRARIGRLDADTSRSTQDAQRIWRAATVGSFDVLVGTQMLFQGPPLPRVGLVGIPHADAGLHVPDFRSAERTYHTLLDAAALARAEDEGGKVVLQTFLPQHHAIRAVANSQPSFFYDEELAVRKATGYPPFASLISLCVSGSKADAVEQAAQQWAKLLQAQARRPGTGAVPGITVLGPVPAAHSRIRGRYRWQLLVKSANAEDARQCVAATLPEIETKSPRGLKLNVDVDPLELI